MLIVDKLTRAMRLVKVGEMDCAKRRFGVELHEYVQVLDVSLFLSNYAGFSQQFQVRLDDNGSIMCKPEWRNKVLVI